MRRRLPKLERKEMNVKEYITQSVREIGLMLGEDNTALRSEDIEKYIEALSRLAGSLAALENTE